MSDKKKILEKIDLVNYKREKAGSRGYLAKEFGSIRFGSYEDTGEGFLKNPTKISDIIKVFKDLEKEFGPDAKFSYQHHFDDYLGDSFNFYVSFYREETDEECKKRLRRNAAARKAAEIRAKMKKKKKEEEERALYEELKKKFEK